MKKTCIICGDDFETTSPEKIKASGKINHCADCSDETEVRVLGLQSSDGKQNHITILKFDSDNDKDKYIDFWKNNSGYNKSKSCQLGNHLTSDPKIHFKIITTFQSTNHKGKQ